MKKWMHSIVRGTFRATLFTEADAAGRKKKGKSRHG